MNRRWKPPYRFATILIADVVLVLLWAACQSRVRADQIRISSKWRGWGSAESTLVVTRRRDAYWAGGNPASAEGVETFLRAVLSPPMKTLNLENLGITAQRLDQIAKTALQRFQSTAGVMLDRQEQTRFLASFKNEDLVRQGLTNAMLPHTDDFPQMIVDIRLANGEQMRVISASQYYFMVPWMIERKGELTRTYNADISRALRGILPSNFTNRARLSGDGFDNIIFWYVTDYDKKIIAERRP